MKPHILIVDDEPTIRLVFTKALIKYGGYTVTATESFEEALSLVSAGAVDAVIMDVALANSRHEGRLIDGVMFTRLLKASAGLRPLPVILVTAYALPGDADRLLAASSADGYLAKPLPSPQLLVEQINALVASSRVA